MKHLFIINPVCTKIKGKVSAKAEEIHYFMKSNPQLVYDIHVSRWIRDALAFCRGYVLQAAPEPVRVHVLGGTGTHFEAVNAIFDLPNVQLALYPMGRTNIFLHYFGLDQTHLFSSIPTQVFARTVAVDAIRCNHTVGISNVLIGLEAYVDDAGDRIIEKTRLPSDFCYQLVAAKTLLTRFNMRHHRVLIDGRDVSGLHYSIMVANQPWYSKNLCPGVDARPGDGILDVYLSTGVNKPGKLLAAYNYIHGRYAKHPNWFRHETGQKLQISSGDQMWLSIDGETFFSNRAECEILPGAIDFVCPDGISI